MKVTVLLLTYNHAPFIACAINSVLMQRTRFDYELVIVDDCSTDGTRETVLEYQRRYPQIIRAVLSETNQCNNRYIEEMLDCSSAYMTWLDGDDCWVSPDRLQRQVDFLEGNAAHVICFHNVLCFFEEGGRRTHLYNQPGVQKLISTIDDLFAGCFIAGCSPMFRRIPHFKVPEWYYSESLGDWPLYMLYAEHGTIGYIDEIMGGYRKHRGGQWSGLSEIQRTAQTVKFLERMNERFDFRFDEEIRRNTIWYKAYLEKVRKKSRTPETVDNTQPCQPYVNAIYWPASMLIGKGEDATPLLENIDIKSAIDVDKLVEVLFEAVPCVGMKTVELWSAIPDPIQRKLEQFLFALEKKGPSSGLAHHVMARLKQRWRVANAALDLLAKGPSRSSA